jgi:hypothetical protein
MSFDLGHPTESMLLADAGVPEHLHSLSGGAVHDGKFSSQDMNLDIVYT